MTVHEDLLFLEQYDPTRAVHAYDSPVSRRWQAPGTLATVDDARVYVRLDVGAQIRGHTELHALDRATGERRWTHAYDGVRNGWGTAHVQGDYYAVLTGEDKRVRAVRLDAATGDRRWQTLLGAGVIPQIATTAETIVVGTERPSPETPARVTVLDRTGERRWDREWPAFYAYPRSAGETVLIGVHHPDDRSTTLVACDPTDGHTRWRTPGALLGVRDGAAVCYAGGALLVRRLA
ncbi:MAG: PQQ-binding-like beta-propeller repeat protein, partial [Halobacteriaceae archaeon]